MLFVLFGLGLAFGGAASKSIAGTIFSVIMLMVVAVKGMEMLGIGEGAATNFVMLLMFIPFWGIWAYACGYGFMSVWSWLNRTEIPQGFTGTVTVIIAGVVVNLLCWVLVLGAISG